jgi:hypothetical protein
MINALHLVWIVPVSVAFGFVIAAILQMEKDDTEKEN